MPKIIVVALLALAACSAPGDVQRSSPAISELDITMFSATALSQRTPTDRAYIMGHAIATYAYGKTLPDLVRPVGFLYRPGISAPAARIPYSWVDTVTVISGGSDGDGAGIEDYGQGGGGAGGGIVDPAGTKTTIGSDTPSGTGGSAGGGTGTGTSGSGGGETYGTPSGSSGGGGSGSHEIDDSCETFLNPAADEAQTLVAHIDLDRFIGDDVADSTAVRASFRAGLAEALTLQNDKQDVKSSEAEAMKKPVRAAGMCTHSPLVLDLDGDGVRASTPAEGVQFDLLARGERVRTAWPIGGDALLAIDRDGDGRIGSGAELFGNDKTHADGFAALAELDRAAMGGNGDGVIDARDAAYAYLVAWRDANRDGISDPGELSPLARLGVTSISLASQTLRSWDEGGNVRGAVSTFTRAGSDGRGAVVDLWFRYQPFEAR